METIAKEDSRVNKMIKLENIFREDPGLFAAYTDWEFEKKLYDATLNHVAVSNRKEGRDDLLFELVKKGLLSLKDAFANSGMTEGEFKAKLAEYNLSLNI